MKSYPETRRKWKLANIEKVRAYKRADYQKHRAKIRAKQRERYLAVREVLLAAKRQRWQDNHDECISKQRAHRAANRQLYRTRQTKDRRANRARYAYYYLKKNAKNKGLEFDLTPDWFEEKFALGHCEMSGVPFDLARRRSPESPSVDRILPNGPYTKANCRMVLWALNRALCNYGEDYMIELFKRVIARREGEQTT